MSEHTNQVAGRTSSSQTPLIIIAWIVVLIPLVYGFVMTLKNAINLFTG